MNPQVREAEQASIARHRETLGKAPANAIHQARRSGQIMVASVVSEPDAASSILDKRHRRRARLSNRHQA